MQSETRESATQGENAGATASADDAPKQVAIQTTIGPLDSSDKELIRGWRNHLDWNTTRQSDFISDVEQEKWFQAQAADPTIRMYAVKVKLGDGDFQTAGVCGLTSLSWIHRHAEFSLYVRPELRGNGFGPRALWCLLNHAYSNLGLNLIWGEVIDGNPAGDIYEKMGFTPNGEIPEKYFKEGRYISAHIYSMRAGEWKIFKDRALSGLHCTL